MSRRCRRLTNFRMVNWHKCADSGIINLNGNTLISGQTGSGKSTFVDALYLVQTLNEHNFNKASGDNSKRDLRSYVRCREDKLDSKGNRNPYSRKGRVITYLLAEMVDKYDNVIVIGTCFVSASDTSDIDKHYFEIRNIELADINVLDEQRRPLEWKAFQSQFSIHDFTSPKTKTDALKLFARAHGFKAEQVDDYQHMCAINAKIMAGKANMVNVDQFIKENILQGDVLNVQSLEKTLNDLNELWAAVKDSEARQVALDVIMEMIRVIRENREKIKNNNVLFTVAQYEYEKSEFASAESELTKYKKEDANISLQMEDVAKQRDYFKKKEFALESTDDKQQLAQFTREKSDMEKRLKVSVNANNELIAAIRNFAMLLDSNEAVKSILESNADLHEVIPDAESLMSLSADLDALNEKLMQCISDNAREKRDLQSEYETLKNETSMMKNGVSANHVASEAIKAINRYFEYNGIHDKAVAICDCIDFKKGEEDWQKAVETYLGASRFNIIVEPENFQEAKNIVHKHHYKNVTVIDTTANFNRGSISGSMCELLTYSNEHAEAYLKDRYGRIIAIDSCLYGVPDKNSSYIAKDCTQYGGKAFTERDRNPQCYIGQNAKNQQIEANNQMLAEMMSKISKLNQKDNSYNLVKVELRKLINKLSNFNTVVFDELVRLPKEIEELQKNIDDLTSEDSMFDAQARLRDVKTQISNCDMKNKELQDRRNILMKEIGVAENRMEASKSKISVIEPQYEFYQENEAEAFDAAKTEYEMMLTDKRKTVPSVCTALEKEKQRMERDCEDVDKKLSAAQKEYSDKFNNAISCGGIMNAEEFEDEYKRIVIVGLPKLRESLETLRAQQVIAIRTGAIKYYREAFYDAEETVRLLNKSLRDVVQGGKTYTLTMPVAAPGFETFYQLIKDTDPDGDAEVEHTDEEYEEFYNFIRTDESYHDYRAFLKCDVAIKYYEEDQLVEKRLSDSIAVSSGGEKQAPFYILCGMALLSAYVKDKTNDVLKFVVIDEAFSYMDATRTESVLDYFDAIGLQLLISVPDRMAKLFEPYTDNQIFVATHTTGRTFQSKESPRKFIEFSRVE